MLDKILDSINGIIKKINDMIINKDKSDNTIMKNLQIIIIIIVLAYIFAKLISVFQFHINYTF